jgi:dTDP-4-dehydrorhamnose 3,5-epimerase
VEDVVVDLRKSSKTFGQYKSYILTGIASSKDRLSLWVPEGFAHGFLTLSETADVIYLQSGVRNEESECGLRWDDPDIGIQWMPAVTSFVVSDKDKNAPLFSELPNADLFI